MVRAGNGATNATQANGVTISASWLTCDQEPARLDLRQR